ncbi:M4 family metallopeptidase [Actinomadura oligospora]|uniref:M4 family metallopeptidase n=1 Tax=Actinomadura oligospora TaxID=111804 RepID=UPI0004AE6953|nr:M4 family metallopeptidase [Actinomadura oligospora]
MRRTSVRLLSRGAGAGVTAYAVGLALAWVGGAVVRLLPGTLSAPVRELPSGLAGPVAMVAGAMGVPLHWRTEAIGFSGTVRPLSLVSSHGFAPLVVALLPVMAAAVAAGVSARRAGGRWRALVALVFAALSYGALCAGAAAVVEPSGMFAVRPEVGPSFLLGFGWTVVAGILALAVGRALRSPATWVARGLRRRFDKRRGLALGAAGVVGVLVASAGVADAAPTPPPGSGKPGKGTFERAGVPGALDRLRTESGKSFKVVRDEQRGTPSMLAVNSPVGGGVPKWMRANAAVFGVADPMAQLKPIRTDDTDNGRFQHYQQVIGGVPVRGARVNVALSKDKTKVTTVANGMRPDIAAPPTSPTVPAGKAKATAARQVRGAKAMGRPELQIYAPDPVAGRASTSGTLVWSVRIAAGSRIWDYLVDARRPGTVVTRIQRSAEALDREVYEEVLDSADHDIDLVLRRKEGDGPSGDDEVDHLYDRNGATYDFFKDRFGRDSFDGHGAKMVSAVATHSMDGEDNAYWSPDDQRTNFSPGMSTQDIVVHEWTHAVTSYTSDLEYRFQSGALNESFSDIMAISQRRLSGGDRLNWSIGYGAKSGILRNMQFPENYGQPARASDYGPLCENEDHGGVHHNSGIPNRAFYNTVQYIGDDPASRVFYTAFTQLLTPGSGFKDAMLATVQAATDISPNLTASTQLAWKQVGITADWVAPPTDPDCVTGGCFVHAAMAMDPKYADDIPDLKIEMTWLRDNLLQPSAPGTRIENAFYALSPAMSYLTQADPTLAAKTAELGNLVRTLTLFHRTGWGAVKVPTDFSDRLNGIVRDYQAAATAAGQTGVSDRLGKEVGAVDLTPMNGRTIDDAMAYLKTALPPR